MNPGDNSDGFERMRRAAQEGLRGWLDEIVSNPQLRESIQRTAKVVLDNKASIDRGLEQMLDFSGIASKRDIRELREQIESVGAKLLNLNLKLDRLAEHLSQAAERPPTKPPGRRRQTRTPREI